MYHASTQGQAHCIGENNCPQQQIFHHPMIMHNNQHVYGYNVPAYIPNRSVPNQATLVYPLGYNPNSTYPVMAPGPAVQPKQLAFLPYPGIQPQLHNNPAMYPQFQYIPVMQLHNNSAFYPQFRCFPVIQTNIHRPIEFMQINGCTYYNPLLQNSGSKGSPPHHNLSIIQNIHRPIEFMQINGCTYYNPLLQNSGSKGSPPHHNLNNIQNIFPVDSFAPQEMSQPEMEINSAKKGSECHMTSLPMKETVALCHDQVSVAAHSQRCLNNSHEILHPITVLQRGSPLQTDLHTPKQVQQPQHAVLMGRVPNGSQSEASQQPPSENSQQNQAVAFGDKEPYNYQQHPKVIRKGHVAYEAKTETMQQVPVNHSRKEEHLHSQQNDKFNKVSQHYKTCEKMSNNARFYRHHGQYIQSGQFHGSRKYPDPRNFHNGYKKQMFNNNKDCNSRYAIERNGSSKTWNNSDIARSSYGTAVPPHESSSAQTGSIHETNKKCEQIGKNDADVAVHITNKIQAEHKTKASFEFVKNDMELKNTCSSAAAEYYDTNVSFKFVNNPLESF